MGKKQGIWRLSKIMTPSEKTAAAVALLEQMNRFKASCRTAQDFSVYRAWLFDQRETLIAFLSLFESGEYVVAQKIMMPPMTRLPPEFEEALYSNLDSLYES